jgi:predicted nucleotidyltransferase
MNWIGFAQAKSMTRDEIVEAIKGQEPALRAEGVAHLALFGSRARGDADNESDLDILIETVPGRRFSLMNLSGVGLLIEDAVGVQSQIVLRRSISPAFATRIEDDLIEVF